MEHARQMSLMDQFFELREARTTPLAEASRKQETYPYVDDGFRESELRQLFRGRFLFAGLSGDARRPGDYFSVDFAGMPVTVVRGEDGNLRALVNVCTHRGARVFPNERGSIKGRGVACPYHSWTYDLYGRLLGTPVAKEGFSDCPLGELSLRSLPVIEVHGLIMVTPIDSRSADEEGHGGAVPSTASEILGSAEADIRDFELSSYTLVDTETRTLPVNWKMVMDTFMESYHIFSLHRDSLNDWYYSAPNLFEDLGPVTLFAGVRSTIDGEFKKPREDRSILPHATLQYILPPNGLVVHQLDHIETWQVFPGATPSEAVVVTKIYGRGDVDEEHAAYLRKSLRRLISITDGEDFPQSAYTQKSLVAGSIDSLTFGRNEPALIHFHEWLDSAMCAPTGQSYTEE